MGAPLATAIRDAKIPREVSVSLRTTAVLSEIIPSGFFFRSGEA